MSQLRNVKKSYRSVYGISMVVFGSSMGVGKSVISAGLCRAALYRQNKAFLTSEYQTGELDEYFVQLYTNPQGVEDIYFRTLYHSPLDASPVASKKSPNDFISDHDLVRAISQELKYFSKPRGNSSGNKQPFTIVETMGGVLSPSPSNRLQADIYRPLRLPVLLVGDSKLGGITTTLTAYESLKMRGYSIHGIAMIDQPENTMYDNAKLIQEYLENRSEDALQRDRYCPSVFCFSRFPQEKLLHNWYRDNEMEFVRLFDSFDESVSQEIGSLLVKESNQKDTPYFIGSAIANRLRCVQAIDLPSPSILSSNNEPRDLTVQTVTFPDIIDARSSGRLPLGHGNPSLSIAIAEAYSRYGAGTNWLEYQLPYEADMENYLLTSGPGSGWAHRILTSTCEKDIWSKTLNVLSSKRIGVAKGSRHSKQLWNMLLRSEESPLETYELVLPKIRMKRGVISLKLPSQYLSPSFANFKMAVDLSRRSSFAGLEEIVASTMDDILERKLDTIIIESIVLGDTEAYVVDPLFLHLLVQSCKQHNVRVIFDEVHSGMFSLGYQSTSQMLKLAPNATVLGDSLTNSYMPMYIGLFDQTWAPSSSCLRPFQNIGPAACAAALESFRLLDNSPHASRIDRSGSEKQQLGGSLLMKSLYRDDDIKMINQLAGVRSVTCLGTFLVIQLEHSKDISNAPSKEPTFANNLHGILKKNGLLSSLHGSNIVCSLAYPLHPAENDSSYDAEIQDNYQAQRVIKILTSCITDVFYSQ